MKLSILDHAKIGVPIVLLAVYLSLSVALVPPAAAKVTPIIDDSGDPNELQGCQAGDTPSGTCLVYDGYAQPLHPEGESPIDGRLSEITRSRSFVKPAFVLAQRWVLLLNVVLSSCGFGL